jgi:hypothetical protein
MKAINYIFYTTIILLAINYTSVAQLQEDYHSCSVNLGVPIVVDHLKTRTYVNGETTEKHIPDKQKNLGLGVMVKDMRVEGNFFSGIKVEGEPYEPIDKIRTFYGEVSEDKKMIKHLTFTLSEIHYSSPDREKAYKKKETNALVEVENLILQYSTYKFKKGVSKVTNIEYTEHIISKYINLPETITESFVKLNDELSYGPSMAVSFTPGNVKLKNKINKAVAVIINDIETNENYKMFMVSISALLTAELMKIPGLKVLERYKTQKLLDEIALSQSVLVNPKYAIPSGGIIPTDIEVLLSKENRVPENLDELFKSFTIRSKIKIVETGQIIDANIVQNINFDSPDNLMKDLTSYIKKVAAFTMNFIYE